MYLGLMLVITTFKTIVALHGEHIVQAAGYRSPNVGAL